jgi:predicted kinase
VCKLLIIRGLPGSGKSTLASMLTEHVVEADQFFLDLKGNYRYNPKAIVDAHKWCQTQVALGMAQRLPLIAVANTFTRKWEIVPYLTMANKHGYTYQVITVETLLTDQQLADRNQHGVFPPVIKRMRERWEPWQA